MKTPSVVRLAMNALGIKDAAALTDLMNRQASVVAQGDVFKVTEEQVQHALSLHPDAIFSANAMFVRLLNYRIWQTLNREHAQKTESQAQRVPLFRNPADLWGEPRRERHKRAFTLGRYIYKEKLLPVLNREENSHIQTLHHLELATGCPKARIRYLLLLPEKAYLSMGIQKLRAFAENRDLDSSKFVHVLAAMPPAEQEKLGLTPCKTLQALSAALGCMPYDLVPVSVWRNALQAQGVQICPSLALGMTETAVLVPPLAEIVPVEEKPAEVVAEFHTAKALLRAYQRLEAEGRDAELALLNRAGGINPQGKVEPLGLVAQDIGVSLCKAGWGLTTTMNALLKAATPSGEDKIPKAHAIAALRLYQEALLTDRSLGIEGQDDVFSLQASSERMPEEPFDSHANLLKAMTSALQGKRAPITR